MSDPKTRRRASRVRSNSFDPESYTVEVVWTTGATVRTFDPWTGEEFDEALSLDDGAVNLDRLNAGAAFIEVHDASECSRVIGSVVRGSARIEGGKGLCTVQLSRARDVADTVLKIREGVIRNVSVGYWVHRYETVEQDGAVPLKIATDWEPLEISAVPVPADAGSQIRSARHRGKPMVRQPISDEQRGAQMASRVLGKPVPRRQRSATERALATLRGQSNAPHLPDPRREAAREAADRAAGTKMAQRLKRRGFLLSR